MTTPRYLLAKYVPDLMRHEPRNIGVIVWSNGEIDARFVAERGDRLDVDGRSIPSFITSSSAYKQWVEYWRKQMAQDRIVDTRVNKEAPKSSEEFLEILKLSNRGNFLLEDGGILFDPVASEDLSAVTSNLFSELVEDPSLELSGETTLLDTCEDLIKASNLSRSPYFKNAFPIECTVNGARDEYTFSYAFQNGSLGKLYQRVPLPKKRKELIKKNIHETAWMFEKVVGASQIDAANTAALVYVTPEQRADKETANLLDVLKSVTRVIDVRSNTAEIKREFEELAAYVPH